MYVLPPQSGSDDTLIVIVMMFVMIAILGIGGYIYFKPEEGDKCKGKDKNAKYEIDDKGECEFVKCDTGYAKDSTGTCVLD